VARISLGRQSMLKLGNLDATRDWGFAGEFVDGMWRMLQAEAPDTFVLATGAATSVRDFARQAFAVVGIDLEWAGAGDDEVGRCAASGRTVVTVDGALRRPAEVADLLGSPLKAGRILGWRPVTTVGELTRMMVDADLVREGAPPGVVG
jgi:GDPmannose 4,6-dehydratase